MSAPITCHIVAKFPDGTETKIGSWTATPQPTDRHRCADIGFYVLDLVAQGATVEVRPGVAMP